MSSDRDGGYNGKDDSFDYRRRGFTNRRGIDRGGRPFYPSSRERGSWDYRGGFQHKNPYHDRRFEPRSRNNDFQKSGDLINRSGDLIGPPRHWSKSKTPPYSQVKEKTPPSKVHGYKMMATQGTVTTSAMKDSQIGKEKSADFIPIKRHSEPIQPMPLERSGLKMEHSQPVRPLSSNTELFKAHTESPPIHSKYDSAKEESCPEESRLSSQDHSVHMVGETLQGVPSEQSSRTEDPSTAAASTSGPPKILSNALSAEPSKEPSHETTVESTKNVMRSSEMEPDEVKNHLELSKGPKEEHEIKQEAFFKHLSQPPVVKAESKVITEDHLIPSEQEEKEKLASSWVFPLTHLESRLFSLKQIPKRVMQEQLLYPKLSSFPSAAHDSPMVKQKLDVLNSQESHFIKDKNFEYHIRLIKWRKMCREMDNQLRQIDPSLKKELVKSDADGDSTNKRRRHGDSVRTEAEFLEILANLEKENEKKDPLYKAEKLAAKIPEMITNPLKRDGYMYLDCNNLVLDKSKWCKERFIEADNFTQKEHDAFCEFFSLNPKKFGRISALMGGLRTRGDCVNHYYRTKKTTNYKQLVASKSKRKLKRKTKSEAPSGDETEEEYNASGRRKKNPMELEKRRKRKAEEEEAVNKNLGSPSSYWSVQEMSKFPELLKLYGSDFQTIADNLGSKTTTMVKNFYLKKASEQGWSELVKIAEETKSARAARPPPTSIMSLLNE